VTHVKVKHGFILGRKLRILLLSHSGRDRSVRAAQVSITCQLITLSLRLNPAVTLSDRYSCANARLVTYTLQSLAQRGIRPHSFGCHVSATEEVPWFNTVITKIVVTVLQCFTVCCWYKLRHIDCLEIHFISSWAVWQLHFKFLFQIYVFWFTERERERERERGKLII
jgi:hypothetical protein